MNKEGVSFSTEFVKIIYKSFLLLLSSFASKKNILLTLNSVNFAFKDGAVQ